MKLKVETVQDIIKQTDYVVVYSLFGSSSRPDKRFLLSLDCGPKRFKVEVEGKETVAFSDLKAAVDYFNKY